MSYPLEVARALAVLAGADAFPPAVVLDALEVVSEWLAKQIILERGRPIATFQKWADVVSLLDDAPMPGRLKGWPPPRVVKGRGPRARAPRSRAVRRTRSTSRASPSKDDDDLQPLTPGEWRRAVRRLINEARREFLAAEDARLCADALAAGLPPPRSCPVCGGPVPGRKDAQVCSSRCRVRALRARRREAVAA